MLSVLNRFRTPPTGVRRSRRNRLPPVSSQSIPDDIVDEILHRQHQRYQILQSLPEARTSQSAPAGSATRPRPNMTRYSHHAPEMRRRHQSRNPSTRPIPQPVPDFSVTERENFDLALGIQASMNNVSTHQTSDILPGHARPVRPTPVPVPTSSINDTPLPSVVVANERATTSCPICLDVIERDARGGMRSRMAPCGHVFHRRCLRRWKQERLQQHQRYECPVCRHDLSRQQN